MKKADLIRINNEKRKAEPGLQKDTHGIVLKVFAQTADVLFFHPKILGEYIIRELEQSDLIVESEKLPEEIEKEIFSDLEKVYANAKADFDPLPFSMGDRVQLIVERECYAKYGIHKDAIGCIVDDSVVSGKVEVDFYEPEEAAAYDSAVAVKTSDLRIV
ncbi:MAG: hypothetical protein J6Y74_02235 [Clostridia bacterium]|nr:hypothetical protein [Clostridia bacterium]